jgi:hypothetical protein
MQSKKMRGAAALAILTLAIAGCQEQGADDSLDTLPSIDLESMDTESMDMESMDSESMDMESMDESAEPSEDS